jgi:hypothetical protein
MKIKSFHLVQTDSGLMNPTELKMTFISVASRIGIIIDLNQFKNRVAYLFFYNYDLTEVLSSTSTFPDQPNNISLTATIPNLEQCTNSTPFPIPIPSINTNLDYPIVDMIPQLKQVLENGTLQVPQNNNNTIKSFLKISMETKPEASDPSSIETRKHFDLQDPRGVTMPWDDGQNEDLEIPNPIIPAQDLRIELATKKSKKYNKLSKTISCIRRTVFGNETYDKYKHILKQHCFEYDPKFNYLSFLNSDYYYNIPNFNASPNHNLTRNIIMFYETGINAISKEIINSDVVNYRNINGVTEYTGGANRILADLWNSKELNLEWALQQYAISPNNYKPPILPTSKFRIYKTNDVFSNTAMISNDTLKFQIFNDEITYGDFSRTPLITVTIIFPPTSSCHHLNLQEWIDLINTTFQNTTISIPQYSSNLIKISDILKCDWSFFPYEINFAYQKKIYIKSAVIKTTNNSGFWVRLLARWPLLQFFGKPLTGNSINPSYFATKLRNNHIPQEKFSALYTKCNEVEIYGIYDAEIQQIFPAYATSEGNLQYQLLA